MTPELRARFELTVKAGEEVVLPYTGIDYRLDLVDWVYFVNVRYQAVGKPWIVECHALTRTGGDNIPTFTLKEGDDLYIAAMERAKA